MQELKQQIEEFYSNFEIDLQVTNIIDTYSITRYFIKLNRTNKTKLSQVENLVEDLSVDLNIKNIKFAIDYATGGAVLEVPKKDRKPLYYKDIDVVIPEYPRKDLLICFGKDLNNNDYMINLCDTPHLLVAGTPRKW